MIYKNAADMTTRDPKEYRSGGRWKNHDRSRAGRNMWRKKSWAQDRDPSSLMGTEVDMAYAENNWNAATDDLTGGHRSSFALVEDAVRLYGKNPDHYTAASEEGA